MPAAHPTVPSVSERSRLLTSRVTGSRYIFPDLASSSRKRLALALAGREECAPDYLVSRDRYPFHVVEYVVEGRGVVSFDGRREHAIGPGSIYAYSPTTSTWMRTDPDAPLVKFFFALTGRDAARKLAEAQLPAGTVRRLAAASEVLTIAEDILHEGQRHGDYAAAICLKLVEVLLLKVAASGQAQASDERARENFLRCRGIIETQASTLTSLEEIARVVRLEPESVCRLFRRFQGTSPYQYLLRRKMTLAAEFLVETGGLVKEAAERVGFVDPYHFTRCFKAVHGVSPAAIRRLRSGRG